MEPTRIFDILAVLQKFGKPDCLASKENGTWRYYSSEEYVEISHQVSVGMIALGMKKGDKIAIISNNRPEWNFIDMGASQIGVINIPIYPTISIDEYKYILTHAQPKLVFISEETLYQKLSPLIKEIESISDVYMINPGGPAKHWREIISTGMQKKDETQLQLEDIKNTISPDDITTIIYTSGTTGNPKGVMLSHKNIMSNALQFSRIHPFGEKDKCLSFLPLCHIYERTLNYHFQHKGISIYYAESLSTIAENLKEVRPVIFATVPRLLENIYDKIITKGHELPFFKRIIFFWAIRIGLHYKGKDKNGFIYKIQLKLADKLVFIKWREALGNEAKVIVSGGAALQPRLARIFGAAGVTVLEGYGLTETSPVIAVNNYLTGEIKYGTVGLPLPNVSVKIADDGEILCKAPSVMHGYYNEPELTREAIDSDGWFHTGDVGIFEDGKYLKITDRKKEIFKLSNGKYVAPQVIENKFKEALDIEHIMVIGEHQKFASALIVPNSMHLLEWTKHHHLHGRSIDELIKHPKVVSHFQHLINSFNRALGQTEQIKRFRLIAGNWQPSTGELSPSLKLRRNFLKNKYADIITDIYAVDKKSV